jgi:hypothetical protein
MQSSDGLIKLFTSYQYYIKFESNTLKHVLLLFSVCNYKSRNDTIP